MEAYSGTGAGADGSMTDYGHGKVHEVKHKTSGPAAMINVGKKYKMNWQVIISKFSNLKRRTISGGNVCTNSRRSTAKQVPCLAVDRQELVCTAVTTNPHTARHVW